MSHQLRSTFNVRDLKVFQNTYWCQYARTSGKSSVSVLGDMGSFFYLEKKDDLIDWELTLPSRFEVRLKGVCLYHKQDFDRRAFRVRQAETH